MIKRPLCLIVGVMIVLQLILLGGFGISRFPQTSYLEQFVREDETVTIQGTVYRKEEKKKYYLYYLKDNQIYHNTYSSLKREKIIVYVEESIPIEIGNKICVTGKVQFFQENRNPGNFNTKLYYQKKNIFASVWSEHVEIKKKSVYPIRENLTKLRTLWKRMLIRSLGETYGNIISAILMGDKSELDESTKQLYQKSGIGHILAISGLHMSFIGISLYTLLRKLGVGFAPAGITGILLLFLYTLMIGAGVSSIRAMIMYIVRMGAEIAGRDYDLLTSLSLSALVIVLWQPLYLFDAGFLLSFGAILGIAVLNPILEEKSAIPKVVCPGLSIQLILLPVMLYYYFELPVWSIILNLLVVPLMTVLLGAGMFGSILSCIWIQGGNLVLQLCKMILWGYEKGCTATMKLPFGRVITGQPKRIQIIIYYIILLGVVLIFYYRDSIKKKEVGDCRFRKWIWNIGIILLFLTFCGSTSFLQHRTGRLEITMLDVGQGDGIYIRTPKGKNCFIDGGSSDISNVGSNRMIPFLESRGVSGLDYVFLSHGDEDHVNGIREMLENQRLGVRIQTLVLPTEQVLDSTLLELAQIAKENQTKVVTMKAGEQIQETLDKREREFILKCIAPKTDYSGEVGNASSMILTLKYGAFNMLFTGDVEGVGEEDLVKNEQVAPVDILKVAHHGSKNSTSEAFLEKVNPKISMISAGIHNRYGHPNQETLNRLKKKKSRVYCTQDYGAITMFTNGIGTVEMR